MSVLNWTASWNPAGRTLIETPTLIESVWCVVEHDDCVDVWASAMQFLLFLAQHHKAAVFLPGSADVVRSRLRRWTVDVSDRGTKLLVRMMRVVMDDSNTVAPTAAVVVAESLEKMQSG
jgi:hypothetical protein